MRTNVSDFNGVLQLACYYGQAVTQPACTGGGIHIYTFRDYCCFCGKEFPQSDAKLPSDLSYLDTITPISIDQQTVITAIIGLHKAIGEISDSEADALYGIMSDADKRRTVAAYKVLFRV